MDKKYKIPVTILTTASKVIGVVECNSLDEFEDKAHELWKSQGFDHPPSLHVNKFDLGEWYIDSPDVLDLKYYKIT